ncbi:MAG: glycosyltransferase family 2 protein [Candidatus Methylacidiphilales bacterium]
MFKLSVIVPFFNEEENVTTVLRELREAVPEAEIIAVDDGSSDRTAELIRAESGVKGVFFSRNLGQSAALYAGLHRATGDILVMMDGDGQNDPADIPALVAAMERGDFVCGYRKRRNDSWQKRVASRIANSIRSRVLGDGCRDTGCTLKAIRREHLRYLLPFNALHRFIPSLLGSAGLSMVEVPANHRARKFGVSKYTVAGRAWRGLRDLFGVRWLLSRRILWPHNPHFPPP